MHLSWLTDIHLNFLSEPELTHFMDELAGLPSEALLITGDIAEADSVTNYLQMMLHRLQRPIYIALGNHDFYRGSIAEVRQSVQQLTDFDPNLIYLTNAGILPLTTHVALVGHDGWPDARNGNFDSSQILLNDFLLIRDFRRPDQSIPRFDPEVRSYWRTIMQRLADESVATLEPLLLHALEEFERVIVATHVPPFRESALYKNHISRDDYQPFFSSQAMGEMLLRAAAMFPTRNIQVYCGHTHWSALFQPAANLIVRTGQAEYGKPAVQETWLI